MLQFNLIVNNQTMDGFKFSFKTDTLEELKIAETLSMELINKITKIEVTVNGNDEY